jgi:hypothetical protein
MLKANIQSCQEKSLTVSGHMSKYNRHGDGASTDELQYVIDKVSFTFLWLYANHMSQLANVFCAKAFMNILSAFCCHMEVII